MYTYICYRKKSTEYIHIFLISINSVVDIDMSVCLFVSLSVCLTILSRENLDFEDYKSSDYKVNFRIYLLNLILNIIFIQAQ